MNSEAPRLLGASLTRLSAIALLLTAALCAHQASTRGWGDAIGPDGTRYRLAPNGMSHLATDGASLAICHWFPLHGTDPLCQPASGAEPSFQRLTYAYPALQSGAWLSFLAMLVLTLAGPQAAVLARTLAALATAGSLLGMALVLSGAPAGVAVLTGLGYRIGGTGLILAAVALIAAVAAGLLIPTSAKRAI